MVRPEGVEPPTYWFVASCSIQLSYGRTSQGYATCSGYRRTAVRANAACQSEWVWMHGAPGRTRTSDPLVRSQMLYPAELRARVNRTVATIADQGGKDKGRARGSRGLTGHRDHRG